MEFLDKMRAERKRRKKLRRKQRKAAAEKEAEAAASRDLFTSDDAGSVPTDEYDSKAQEGIAGTVMMFSGCKDSQTSADVHDVGSFGLPDADGAGGACTHALLKAVQDGAESWMAVLKGMREVLATKRFTQVPQLSSSRRVNLNDPFAAKVNDDGPTRALLIGINYVGQQGELSGCHNDVVGMKDFLLERGFDETNMRILADDGEHEPPTRDAILEGFDWLVEGAQDGESLFCHYSGHGGSVRDDDGDEADGYDETLVPLDYQNAGQIRDDEIFGRLVAPVPRGAHLTVLIDACHSGTVLDLPYMFEATDDALVAAAEMPPEDATLAQNPAFDFQFLFSLAKKLFDLKMGGASNEELCSFLKSAIGMG